MEFPGLLYGISAKVDGSMGPSDREKTRGEEANLRSFFAQHAISTRELVRTELCHGNNITVASGANRGTTIPRTDALVTDTRELVLAITVADCFPVWFIDPEKKIVGVAHAGWKGVAFDIVSATLSRMVKIGGHVGNIHVRIGPGICTRCFEVQEDILPRFEAWKKYIIRENGKIYIDLVGILSHQLIVAGIAPHRLEVDGHCTFHDHTRYFSYRRDKPERLQSMVAFIGMR